MFDLRIARLWQPNGYLALRLDMIRISHSATDHLATFLRHAQSQLKELELDLYEESSHFQEGILSALCENSTIRKLCFEGGFFDLSCRMTVSDLLIMNRHLDVLDVTWESGSPSYCHDWKGNLEKGLWHNWTLKKASLAIFEVTDIDVRPLFHSAVVRSSGLQSLDLLCGNLVDGCEETIASTLSDPLCRWKKLDISCKTDDVGFLHLLSGVESSTSLQEVELEIREQLSNDAIRRIGPFLSKVTVNRMKITADEFFEDQLPVGEEEVTQRIHREILRGVRSNHRFESLSVTLPPSASYDQQALDHKMEEYCRRNAVVKAARALADCELSHAALPRVLEAVGPVSDDSEDDYSWLSATAVFSGLKTMLQNSEKCTELKSFILGKVSRDEWWKTDAP